MPEVRPHKNPKRVALVKDKEYEAFSKRIALRLQRCRKAAGLTQEDLSAETGIDLRTIQRIEAADRRANAGSKTHFLLGRALNVDPVEFYMPIAEALKLERRLGRPRQKTPAPKKKPRLKTTVKRQD
jgi:transcriptional regulator with XRE-family HTH domain